MSKALKPSGYRIINVDMRGKTVGEPFTPETDDEKLLLDILEKNDISKPILLCVLNEGGYYCGFAPIIYSKVLCLTYGSIGSLGLGSIDFTINNGKLVYQFNEE